MKNEVEMTFLKLLEEELLLEKNCDLIRKRMENRWDYTVEAAYKTIGRNEQINYKKLK